jgi:hypothetical protein
MGGVLFIGAYYFISNNAWLWFRSDWDFTSSSGESMWWFRVILAGYEERMTSSTNQFIYYI